MSLSPPPANPPPDPEGPPPARATVLVASSDSATRDLLRRVLDGPAVEVVDASDGVEALALARRLDLDLVVLDAFLAVMDGLTVCARIRALTDVDQPPILVLGLSSERSIEVALTSGADETLAKPLNPALLRYRARVLLVRRQEERRLHLLQRAVEAAPFGMALLDARSSEYEVAIANPAFLSQTGYAAGEILGKNLRLLAGPATDVAAMTDLRQAMAEGRPTRVLLRSYRKDGEAYWNDLAAAPVVDVAGRLTHYVSVQSDVTALLEAPGREAARAVDEAVALRTAEVEAALARVEERRRFTETILNSLVSGILATDAKGTVTFANLAALRTLGTSLHDCIGRSVVELFGHHEGVAEVIAGATPAHPEHRLDFPLISPGGTRFYVGMSITPAPPAFRDEVAFIFLFRDLAETIDIETDPKLKQLAAAQDEADARLAPALAEEAAATPEAKHRVLLALRYTAPADLARAAIQALAHQHQADGEFVRLETADDVPEVLLDRQQVTEALTILLASALEACPDPAEVRMRLTRVDATSGPGAQSAPGVRIEIAYPAVITDRDLGTDPGGTARSPQRRTDFATAEKLLEANGGRLIRPPRDAAGGPVLAVLLRAAR
ncbi:MAG TPA: PAS domain-containing protein [Vicinamibacteria bacterium]|nr:PAS domain-containing protein [Vicinamibacteria bacterium]